MSEVVQTTDDGGGDRAETGSGALLEDHPAADDMDDKANAGAGATDVAPADDGRVQAALAAGTAHVMCLCEADGTLVHASPSWKPILGYDPNELVGIDLTTLAHPDDAPLLRAILEIFRSAPRPGSVGDEGTDLAWDVRIRHHDGGYRTIETLANNLLDDPEVGGLLFVGRDITERRMLDDALTSLTGDASGTAAIHQLLGFLDARIQDTESALWIADPEPTWITRGVPDELQVTAPLWQDTVETGAITLIPELLDDERLPPDLVAAATTAGYRSCWVFPMPSDTYASMVNDRPADEVRPTACLVVWSRRHLEPFVTNWFTLFLVNPYLHLALLRRSNDLQIRSELRTDPVTGVLSRVGLQHELQSGHEGEVAYAVLVADLDGFKGINDRHGHEVGDAVLAEVAHRMTEVVRDVDVVGRLGGDEFLICLAGASLQDAVGVARRLCGALAEPVEVGEVAVPATVSVGVARADAESPLREVVARADQAMYDAKRAGKATWVVSAG
jgi:diguanylate cyclase (GGDEF)-like protein/PAS domain S-box-containing protein